MQGETKIRKYDPSVNVIKIQKKKDSKLVTSLTQQPKNNQKNLYKEKFVSMAFTSITPSMFKIILKA